MLALMKGGTALFKNFSRRHRLDFSECDLQYEYIPKSLRNDVYNHLMNQHSNNDSNVVEYCLYRCCSLQVNWQYLQLGNLDEIMEYYTPNLFTELLQECSWHEFLSIVEFLIDKKKLSVEDAEELFKYHRVGYEIAADEEGNNIVIVKYDKLIEDTDYLLEKDIEYQGVLDNLKAAKKALHDRHNIDLCNSVKNSVNALEAYLIGMLGDPHITTFGNAIKRIRRNSNVPAHVVTALEQFSTYRNATDNVGHGSPVLADITSEDALLCHEMSVSLINYFHKRFRQRKKSTADLQRCTEK